MDELVGSLLSKRQPSGASYAKPIPSYFICVPLTQSYGRRMLALTGK